MSYSILSTKIFVPNRLDLNYITKENFLQLQTRNMVKALFTEGKDVAILVADGIYIYREKNSNYSFQRRSFSMHKGRRMVMKQHDATSANKFRLVTKIRWIVEFVNGLIKTNNLQKIVEDEKATSIRDFPRLTLQEADILRIKLQCRHYPSNTNFGFGGER
ncbi:hypothetical protein ALC56_04049 [Trachymyrmex septentrionalis]|uniref:DDE Tnp4 domain-containing protein n=1 Tax=Trachymyrmex septentrionalis TaxID=34720 RepID=A0A151JYL4_9HYME|nr:hypothetical protein ALC56_04049 [Trachymyrmex septentrionalis]